MQLEEISIRVDHEAARVYRSATDDERRKLDLLLSLRIQDVNRSGESLEQIMKSISRNAQQRGLTPEILTEILNEK